MVNIMPQLLIPGARCTVHIEYEDGLSPEWFYVFGQEISPLILLGLEPQSLSRSAFSLDATDWASSAPLADLLWDGVQLFMLPTVGSYFALYSFIFAA